MVKKQYRYLSERDLVRYGDERFDYEFGWTVIKDKNLERFSAEYRRISRKDAHAKRWRRPVEVNHANQTNS